MIKWRLQCSRLQLPFPVCTHSDNPILLSTCTHNLSLDAGHQSLPRHGTTRQGITLSSKTSGRQWRHSTGRPAQGSVCTKRQETMFSGFQDNIGVWWSQSTIIRYLVSCDSHRLHWLCFTTKLNNLTNLSIHKYIIYNKEIKYLK